MNDAPLITTGITLFAILVALMVNRKSIEDMRDVLRAEAKAQTATLQAEAQAQAAQAKLDHASLKAEVTTQFSGVNNKLDHLLEVVARHSERLEG